MYQQVKIIINPISGAGKGIHEGSFLRNYLEKEGIRVFPFITKKTGDAQQEARDTNFPIIVIGGDGTVNEVVNGLGGRSIPLIIFPVGTANLLSKEVGLSKNFQDIKNLIQYGKIRLFDTGYIQGNTQRQRRFLSLASLGFDAEITRLMMHKRNGLIHPYSYLMPIWQVLKEYSFPFFTMFIDDRFVAKGTTAIIGNIKKYGGYFSITKQAKPDDGLLDVCIFQGRSRLDYFRYFLSILLHCPTVNHDVQYFKGKKIKIISNKPIPVELDGDFWGYTPITCGVTPRTIPLLLAK